MANAASAMRFSCRNVDVGARYSGDNEDIIGGGGEGDQDREQEIWFSHSKMWVIILIFNQAVFILKPQIF